MLPWVARFSSRGGRSALATVGRRNPERTRKPGRLPHLAAALLVVLAFTPVGCKHKKAQSPPPLENGAPELAATVHVGDSKVAEQLVSGFHSIEANAWRWTERKFVVVLRAPAGSGQLGASLLVHLTVPPVVIEKLAVVTLSASIGDEALAPESYSKPGDYVYQRDVPATLIRSSAVRVGFQLDKAIPPGPADQRELGIVVSSIGLALK